MEVIGVTGLAGSGKSIIMDMIVDMGYPSFKADIVARNIMLIDEKVITEIVDVFGMDILVPEIGLINRMKLGEMVFSDIKKLKKLEDIIIPKTRDRLLYKLEICECDEQKLAFVESANLFASGFDKYCNKIIWVEANEETRLNRIKSRGWSDKHIKNIIKAQVGFVGGKDVCDFIIDNSNKDMEDLKKEIKNIIEQLLEEK